MVWTYLASRELTDQWISDSRHGNSGIKGELPGYGDTCCNGHSLEEEAREWQIQGQIGLHGETLSQTTTKRSYDRGRANFFIGKVDQSLGRLYTLSLPSFFLCISLCSPGWPPGYHIM